MSILSADYVKQGILVRTLTRDDIDKDSYINTYRGNLICSTLGCEAKLVFSSGRTKHFKTWQRSDHSANCIHRFERIKTGTGVDRSKVANVTASEERIQQSLKNAYFDSTLTNEEKEKLKERKSVRKEKSPIVEGKGTRPIVQLVADGEKLSDEGEEGNLRAPNIRQKELEAFNEKDIGKTKTIKGGFIKGISFSKTDAVISVEQNKSNVDVRFGEAFRANDPDAFSLFHLIQRYVSENEQVRFTGYGEIRFNGDQQKFELWIFEKDRFLIETMSLSGLAAYYVEKNII